MPAITDSVQFVKGIGPKKVKLFEKLHISTLQDALETYPRDYEDRTHITRIADIADEDRYAVRAILGTEPKVSRIRKGMTLVKCTIFDESGSLGVTWFNQPYITAQLRVGQEYLFYGRVQGFGRVRQMISPQAEKVAENDQNPGRIVPVYPLTAGLTQRDMARVTEAALDAVPGDWPDPLPEVLRVKCFPRGVAVLGRDGGKGDGAARRQHPPLCRVPRGHRGGREYARRLAVRRDRVLVRPSGQCPRDEPPGCSSADGKSS